MRTAATVPGLTARITNVGESMRVKILGASLNFELEPGVDLVLDGVSLRQPNVTINLKDQPTHELIVSCN